MSSHIRQQIFQRSQLHWRCSSAGGVLWSVNTPEDTETVSVFLSCVFCYKRPLFVLFFLVFPFCYSHFLSLPSVKPNAPEKLTVNITWNKNLPYLRASWEPPQKADTRSGWITLIYELRTKLEGEDEWEVSKGVAWLAKLSFTCAKWKFVVISAVSSQKQSLRLCTVQHLHVWVSVVVFACLFSSSRNTLPANRKCLRFTAFAQVEHTWFRCAVGPITASGVNGATQPTSKYLSVRDLLICHIHKRKCINLNGKYDILVTMLKDFFVECFTVSKSHYGQRTEWLIPNRHNSLFNNFQFIKAKKNHI